MAFSEMVNHMSNQGLRDSAERGLRALARVRSMAASAREAAGQAIQTLEVSASAFGFGFARGFFSKPGEDLTVLGVPVDLAAGIAGHSVAIFGGLGKYREDVHNLADGGLASYLTTLGLKLGVEQQAKSNARPAALPAAASGMSIQELVRRAANV